MTVSATSPIAVSRAIDDVVRSDRGRILARLIGHFGQFQLAEDAFQDAVISALGHWGRSGVPNAPAAWLYKVAKNKGIDRIRTQMRAQGRDLAYGELSVPPDTDTDEFPDDRLRLMFTCCHPALDEKSRIALTLRAVCQLSTREIADAFLDREPTMAQRISRAKSVIASKQIPYQTPDLAEIDQRLETVLKTIYVIFTTGYVRDDLPLRDLCQEGIFLVSLMNDLFPNHPEIMGAYALMLFTWSRRDPRIDAAGATVPIEFQHSDHWDHAQIKQAQNLLSQALVAQRQGPFQIKAALADCHMVRPKPDWEQMRLLYAALWQFEPTAVVALNWAVVLAELGELNSAFDQLEALAPSLNGYQPFHAARAYLLSKMLKPVEAKQAFEKAIMLCQNSANRKYLQQQSDLL